MNFLSRWLKPKVKAAQSGKLYEPGEAPDSFESINAALERLRRYESLLGNRVVLRELVDEKLAIADKSIANPLISDQTGQFYRGAYWLAKELFEKLAGLENEINERERVLTEARRKKEQTAEV